MAKDKHNKKFEIVIAVLGMMGGAILPFPDLIGWGFVVFTIVSAVTLFMSRNILKRFQSQRMENLLQVHLWFEVKFIIVLGVVLYGLCQYNQVNLAWVFLLLPVIYVILKNLFI